MNQRKFKLNPAAIAAILAIASPLMITPAHAASTTTTGNGSAAASGATKKPTEIAHNAEVDKPEATKAVKNSRATRAALHNASTSMETTRQTLRKKP